MSAPDFYDEALDVVDRLDMPTGIPRSSIIERALQAAYARGRRSAFEEAAQAERRDHSNSVIAERIRALAEKEER